MRVLVTGAAGFIGSHLVDGLLADGHQVVGVDNLSTGAPDNLAAARRCGGFVLHQLDVADPALVEVVRTERVDVVCHLAAHISVPRSVAEPANDARVNVLGTLNVLEAARHGGIRKVVFASSVAVYGIPAVLPVGVDAPLAPRSPYAASKRSGEIYLETYRALHGLEFTTLTLANVYGPRQSAAGESGVVAIFMDALLGGKPTRIFGRGDQTRDYVYVGDVVDAFRLACGDRCGGERLNVGTGVATSDRELHTLVAEVVGAPDTPEYAPPRPGDLPAMVIDPGPAQARLGWSPRTSLREGVTEAVAWTRSR